jgi:hypothetical protein
MLLAMSIASLILVSFVGLGTFSPNVSVVYGADFPLTPLVKVECGAYYISPIHVDHSDGSSAGSGVRVTVYNSGGSVVYSAVTDINGSVLGPQDLCADTYDAWARWEPPNRPDCQWAGHEAVSLPPSVQNLVVTIFFGGTGDRCPI